VSIHQKYKNNFYIYHLLERGQNENANVFIRQYFPKGMGFIDITIKEVIEAVDKLNSRPRKCLD